MLNLNKWSLRGLLYLLSASVAVPVAGMLAFTVYQKYQQDEQAAADASYNLARLTADNVGLFIEDARHVLSTLSKRPQMQQEGCDPIFKDFKDLYPRFTNMSRSTPEGFLVCSALAQPGNKPTDVNSHAWFKQLYLEQKFIVGPIVFGPINKGWISVLAHPIFDTNAKMIGGLQTPIDLIKLKLVPSQEQLPPATLISIIDSKGNVIARSQKAEEFVGKNLRGIPIVEIALAQGQGVVKSQGLENIERIYGFTPVKNTDWTVIAGTTSEFALGDARQAAKSSAAAGFMVLMFVLLLVIAIAKYILKPVRSIRNTALQVATGDMSHRATLGGPIEIVEVATQFNTMLGAITEAQAQLAKSQQRLQLAMEGAHLAWWELDLEKDTIFLSETWSAIVGGTPVKTIYQVSEWNELIPVEDFVTVQESLVGALKNPEKRFLAEHRVKSVNGDLIWVLSQGHVTARDSHGQALRLVGIARDITDRKIFEAEIQKLAFFDPLTGLPNRRLLMDRLEQALLSTQRHNRLGALLFIDLDHFKILNDTLGHLQGDKLLMLVGERLRSCIREVDTAARLGGDEFVVMLSELSEDQAIAATQAEGVGEKILKALNQDYELANQTYKSTPSIGITLFGMEKGESIEEPLKRADMAMYQAKNAGRNTLRFYDPHMQAVVNERLSKESHLAQALERGEFTLHYQPQMSDTDTVTGAECLVRWQHPSRGMVSPAEFIPLAEETGMIVALGQIIMETACRQLGVWSAKPGFEHLTLAVNVSAKQFYQDDFVAMVLDSLERHGASPHLLELELTEGVMLERVDQVIQKMNALKDVGIRFSLDDFGTGYSSLSYLKLLPLNQLKIDQGFVRDILIDPNDAAIAKMIIVLADSLHLRVIAEGVETASQHAHLAALGCHAYQGYFFSRPVAIDVFEAFVQTSGGSEKPQRVG